MENNITLEIGQKVHWNINNQIMKGVVLEDNLGETVKVVSHFAGYKPHVQLMLVPKKILTENW
tara:strand:- start:15539 stop:15727 length:189 start_codon:yes stop_codon:yes gene_type:complete